MSLHRGSVLLSALGAGLAVGGFALGSAAAATDDELAYAAFGEATELLLQDYYTRTAATKVFAGRAAREVARGGLCAAEHAAVLGNLLADAGEQPAAGEDLDFAWPEGTFASRAAIVGTGLTITRNLGGVYVSAATAVTLPSHRRLYASMAASLAQQVAFLTHTGGGRAIGVSFPPAVEIEPASDAIEAFLG